MAVTRLLSVDDAEELTALVGENREFLAPWEPQSDARSCCAFPARSAGITLGGWLFHGSACLHSGTMRPNAGVAYGGLLPAVVLRRRSEVCDGRSGQG